MYICTKTKRKEDKMSFCGIVLTYEGIVGFADNKATIKNWIGENIEDVGRNPQKIINGKDLIIITTGTNKVLDEFDEFVNLEKCLNTIMEQYSYRKLKTAGHDIEWLFNTLKVMVQKTIDANPKHYYKFLVGYKENHYKVNEITLSKEVQTLSETRISNQDFYQYGVIGDEIYCEIFKGIQFDKSYPLNELPHILKHIMENLIQINDLTRKYNPVGLPVTVEVFK